MNLSYFQVQYGIHNGLEVLIDPKTKEMWVTHPTIERLLEWESDTARKKQASKSLKGFAQKYNVDLTTKSVECLDKKKRVNRSSAISEEAFQLVLAWEYANTLSPKIFEILNDCWKIRAIEILESAKAKESNSKTAQRIPKGKREQFFQGIYSERFNGEVEVGTPHGRADIVTSDMVYEIKTYTGWKSALGQVLVYSYHLSKKPGLILFDCPDNLDKTIKEVCSRFGVSVIFDV